MRRHSEQLQSVATSGVDGKVIRTAPQWHEPSCIGNPWLDYVWIAEIERGTPHGKSFDNSRGSLPTGNGSGNNLKERMRCGK